MHLRHISALIAVLAIAACTDTGQSFGNVDQASRNVETAGGGLDASHLQSRDARQDAYRGIRYGRR